MSNYHYGNLTSAVKDKGSPLRQYLDRRFPNTRPLQTAYLQQGGPLLVDGGDANGGTVGTAFDLMVRFALDPGHKPLVAAQALRDEPHLLAEIVEVMKAAHAAMAGSENLDQLARASWALALTTEVFRAGLWPGSPVTALLERQEFTASALLDLAPEGALCQLRDLYKLAQERLFPTILPATRLDLGPTFEGSTLCPADADLIHDGRLVDIKTHLGTMNKQVRSSSLALTDLYQIVVYVLFDRRDEYAIRSLGIYEARYGTLVTWPLSEALETMAGGTVNLADEREVVWALLGG